MTKHPECPYCGATTGLRIECQGDGLCVQTDYICAGCFDDLQAVSDDGEPGEILAVFPIDEPAQPDPFPALVSYVMFGRLP